MHKPHETQGYRRTCWHLHTSPVWSPPLAEAAAAGASVPTGSDRGCIPAWPAVFSGGGHREIKKDSINGGGPADRARTACDNSRKQPWAWLASISKWSSFPLWEEEHPENAYAAAFNAGAAQPDARVNNRPDSSEHSPAANRPTPEEARPALASLQIQERGRHWGPRSRGREPAQHDKDKMKREATHQGVREGGKFTQFMQKTGGTTTITCPTQTKAELH